MRKITYNISLVSSKMARIFQFLHFFNTIFTIMKKIVKKVNFIRA